MRKAVLNRSKALLTRIGARLPRARVDQLSAVSNYLALGRWMADRGFHFDRRVYGRDAVFDEVARRVASEHVLYLEFGVYQGASMRYWSRALTHPKSSLHGFDSFAGLPEDGGIWQKGQFDVRGRVPDIDDARVQFFAGWFEETLPTYTPPPHTQLVINLDADLYSSTKFVLTRVRPLIKPGTFIYFDDLCQVDHEPRAFKEFMDESGLRFRPVVGSVSLGEAFFECVS